MKPPPNDPEFRRFTEAMRQMMKVSKTEILRRMEQEKQGRERKTSTARAQAAGK
jgi:hypothetical protein